jgi:nucleoside-triphosphatase THEP1
MMAPTAPMLAALQYSRGLDVSAIMMDAIAELRTQGLIVGGLLQVSEMVESEQCSSVHLVDLRSGQKARITQNRGKASRGCKLDEQGLLSLSHCINRAIDDCVDLVVISRFGRSEATGHGLLSCFTDVVCAGIPLLTSVREPHVDPWRNFHGGLALDLQPSANVIIDWFGSLTRPRQTVECRANRELVE